MSMIGARRRHVPDATTDVVNPDLARALRDASAKGLTGSIDVVDLMTKGSAHLYLYEGGLYAVELPGYVPPVLSRLGIPHADAADEAVASGAVPIEALAGIHQEFVIASLGAVLALPRVRTKVRKARTTARFCTLPLPVEPLFDLVRMRADRLAGTWAMLAPSTTASTTVALRRSAAAPPPRGEAALLLAAVDGLRTLDALAAAAGFTRAEAVHLASGLVHSGHLVMAEEAIAGPVSGPLLVPEEFGSRVPDAVPPAAATRAWSVPRADAASPESRTPTAVLVDDLSERQDLADLDPIESARAAVIALVEELQDALRAEQTAVERTAEVSRRLREARAVVDRLESGVPAPAT